MPDPPAQTLRSNRNETAPFRREGRDADEATVCAQAVDDLKRATRRITSAGVGLHRRSRFLEAALSSIPDFVYAFDPQRRFVYANHAMLALFGLSADEMLGRTFADLGPRAPG